MTDPIESQMLELVWQETKLRRNRRKKNALAALRDKVEGVIPPRLIRVLEEAFFTAFQFVFCQGAGVIELTFDKKKLRPSGARPDLARLERRIKGGAFANTALATIEGGGLGLVGWGLPDIPLFLAMLLKNTYEIALRHGFSYEGKGERIFILTVLRAALVPAESPEGPDQADDVAERLDMGLALYENETETMRQTSQALARAMLVGKFIQGYPVVGVAGGWVNNAVMRKVSDYAVIKYRKRFLRRLGRQNAGPVISENGDE
ncbi:MAG: EcsC family protein [Gracilibacteraceae bacterium]|jgi:hypothetical protein|nr:EcsC family protein [Gracilibacteraceae bacterium]